MKTLSIVLALAGLLAAPSVRAAIFCVDSAADIQAALNTAASNNEDDSIGIVAGTYALTTGLTFASSEARRIIIYGGTDPSCNVLAFGETVLDGQHLVRPLYVGNAHGTVGILYLTFAGGQAGTNSGGGLVAASDSGNVTVLLNQFVGNRSQANAGGLYASSNSGVVDVTNNLFLANRGNEGGGLVVTQASGEGHVTNNTIVANISDTAGVPAGLVVLGAAHFSISNNIIWNNAGVAGSDFGAQSAHSRYTNDIGIVAAGANADAIVGELSVEPQFAPCGGVICFSFELDRASPLVDTGTDAAAMQDNGAGVDLHFKPRILGSHVDIGAYENDVVFADGFDP